MPGTIFDRADLADEARNVRDKLSQIRSATQVVKAKTEELNAMKQRLQTAVTAGIAEQADINALDALTLKVAALYAACNAYLA